MTERHRDTKVIFRIWVIPGYQTMSTIEVPTVQAGEHYLWNAISQTVHSGLLKAANREELVAYAAQCRGALQAQRLSDMAEIEIQKMLFKRIDTAMNKIIKRRGWNTDLAQPLKQAINNVSVLTNAIVKMDKDELDWKTSYMAMSVARDEHYLFSSYKDRERIIILINLHNLKHPGQTPIRYVKL
jgi:hypothetical protein